MVETQTLPESISVNIFLKNLIPIKLVKNSVKSFQNIYVYRGFEIFEHFNKFTQLGCLRHCHITVQKGIC